MHKITERKNIALTLYNAQSIKPTPQTDDMQLKNNLKSLMDNKNFTSLLGDFKES